MQVNPYSGKVGGERPQVGTTRPQVGDSEAAHGPRVEQLLPAAARSTGRAKQAGVGAGGLASVVSLSPDALSAMAQKALETKVGEQISAAFAEAGVDLAEAAGQDWSVDATAQRIVDFSTGLYGIFRDQNPDLGEEEALSLFEETLRGAVDRGHGEAREVLEGMSLSDDILGQADATITRVHELFDEYFAKQREAVTAPEQQPEAGAGAEGE